MIYSTGVARLRTSEALLIKRCRGGMFTDRQSQNALGQVETHADACPHQQTLPRSTPPHLFSLISECHCQVRTAYCRVCDCLTKGSPTLHFLKFQFFLAQEVYFRFLFSISSTAQWSDITKVYNKSLESSLGLQYRTFKPLMTACSSHNLV